MVTVAARRELVRFGRARGLSERHALRMAGMSGSVLRYRRRDEGNQVCASALSTWHTDIAATGPDDPSSVTA